MVIGFGLAMGLSFVRLMNSMALNVGQPSDYFSGTTFGLQQRANSGEKLKTSKNRKGISLHCNPDVIAAYGRLLFAWRKP